MFKFNLILQNHPKNLLDYLYFPTFIVMITYRKMLSFWSNR